MNLDNKNFSRGMIKLYLLAILLEYPVEIYHKHFERNFEQIPKEICAIPYFAMSSSGSAGYLAFNIHVIIQNLPFPPLIIPRTPLFMRLSRESAKTWVVMISEIQNRFNSL